MGKGSAGWEFCSNTRRAGDSRSSGLAGERHESACVRAWVAAIRFRLARALWLCAAGVHACSSSSMARGHLASPTSMSSCFGACWCVRAAGFRPTLRLKRRLASRRPVCLMCVRRLCIVVHAGRWPQARRFAVIGDLDSCPPPGRHDEAAAARRSLGHGRESRPADMRQHDKQQEQRATCHDETRLERSKPVSPRLAMASALCLAQTTKGVGILVGHIGRSGGSARTERLDDGREAK